MAGIGFELRQQLRKDTYADMFRAYLAAGIIGSGPWLVSIGSMLFIGLFAEATGRATAPVTTFLATVTHLMAISLVACGFVQLVFVRFVADRLFEKQPGAVVPNLMGALLLVTTASAALGAVEAATLFDGPWVVRGLFVASYATLSGVWLVSVLLTGVKAYRRVLAVFVLGYAVVVGLSLALSRKGLPGYLAGFVVGQGVMLFCMLALVMRDYPSERLIAFGFLDRKRVFPELALVGGLFNLAVWIDKFVFWADPVTSVRLVGPIRYSVVYDVPLFLAYLSTVPGMAVFFVRIETDFAESYDRFFDGVRRGETLGQLRRLRNELVSSARAGIFDIFMIQGLTVVVLILAGDRVLTLFHIPHFYGYLFKIDAVGVGFQVVLLGTFTVLFYLDYRKVVLAMSALFAAANLGLSILSLRLGPRFYGFGFTIAVALTSLVALRALSRKLDRLEYETFMR